ncbi:hypothetical protein FDI24_gp032 [Acidovorax phage ACP17]|uniref:Uncharacterized protein n=1 Tax=Acidovorax phage ACP17 TaxID=2010329 RepID=A0A218M3D7_9CAUD|nr:hypothetical protein FDI24_gp032 [Acidovorax phage ACP17]ASD50566.1 hypothetical protein [Acidovorax phage ACP17]
MLLKKAQVEAFLKAAAVLKDAGGVCDAVFVTGEPFVTTVWQNRDGDVQVARDFNDASIGSDSESFQSLKQMARAYDIQLEN